MKGPVWSFHTLGTPCGGISIRSASHLGYRDIPASYMVPWYTSQLHCGTPASYIVPWYTSQLHCGTPASYMVPWPVWGYRGVPTSYMVPWSTSQVHGGIQDNIQIHGSCRASQLLWYMSQLPGPWAVWGYHGPYKAGTYTLVWNTPASYQGRVGRVHYME